jgi:hypothetical protein
MPSLPPAEMSQSALPNHVYLPRFFDFRTKVPIASRNLPLTYYCVDPATGFCAPSALGGFATVDEAVAGAGAAAVVVGVG